METEQEPKKEEKAKPSRGRYSQYTPELRAKIGKYALKHGNAAAARHFTAELGHELPESTIRGMRDKYAVLSEAAGGGVAAVGCGPRGRPVSLGQHDGLVQEAVKQLRDRGEKVTAFVVIAVAKQVTAPTLTCFLTFFIQVLMQQEPSLLQEHGGSLRLTTTWAKSVLRRLGIRARAGARETTQ